MSEKHKKYHLITFGCQMNVHDSERMAGILKSESLAETDLPKDADIIIFNTCSIRQKAEQKFYSMLGRVKSLKKTRPNLKIAVAGCIAQQEGAELLRRIPELDYVLGPQNIHVLKDIINAKASALAVGENPHLTTTKLPSERKDRIKAWVNIMYGCNNFCSYCVVPYTRGREQGRVSGDILNEIRELAEAGYKEVTLLGQNVNSYKSTIGFPELLAAVNGVEGIERIRFVTSHPKDLSDGLVNAIRDLDKVCEHIHLPLQSGSTRILSLMNRKYTYEHYMRRIEKLRKEIPEIAITSDVIAGFPQETAEDHQATIQALKEVEFDGIFAFKYSPRPMTAAAEMEGHLEDTLKSERLSEILALQNEITEQKNKKLEGAVQEVLIEGEDGSGKLMGKTRTNKCVVIPQRDGLHPGDVLNVTITKAFRHSLRGKPVS